MKQPSKAQIDAARAKYPKGTRIELPSGMDDEYSPIPAGTRGTVVGVDDMLNLMVEWDNGSMLNAIIGHDDIAIITSPITDAVFEQIMEIRKHPHCPNMFDANAVQRLAFDLGYYELVDLLASDRKAYSAFILSGRR
jgi:hypothetical protein